MKPKWRYVSGEDAHWARSDGFVVRRTGRTASVAYTPYGTKAHGYDKAPEVSMARIDKHYPENIYE